ncbi:40S ribosomal protein S2 [Trifolium repens]|nr:40S ribosomal protein S2 [Trifolium repens]
MPLFLISAASVIAAGLAVGLASIGPGVGQGTDELWKSKKKSSLLGAFFRHPRSKSAPAKISQLEMGLHAFMD